jgi:hypothetical protein
MGIDLYAFSLVDQHFFYQLKCIHSLTWECTFCSFLIHVLPTYAYNPP